MKKSKIELVVFDIAGTTVKDENYVHQCLVDTLKEYGYSISIEEANSVMGYAKPLAIKELLQIKEEDRNKITNTRVDTIHTAFVQAMIRFYKNAPVIVPTLHAEETFTWLRSVGISVALDTGFSKEITDVIIERLQWKKNKMIDACISSDEVKDGRPYPYMIHTLMRHLNISSPENVAKVGDTISDLLEGSNAECQYVIGITTGAYSRTQLETAPHTHLINDLLEITDIVLP